ncbi:MAG: hypothetical protein AB8C95_07605 [Phycisphaeraceae bacterium]
MQATQQIPPPVQKASTPAPVQAKRPNPLGYIACGNEMHTLAKRLEWQGYRGAICGPTGCGKSIMLQTLGDELMEHGLTPLPLIMHPDQRGTFPKDWKRIIRQARPTDALLLDGYGDLPRTARLWVWLATLNAGAIVVTASRETVFTTLAKPKPTPGLLEQLIEQTLPTQRQSIDTQAIFEQAQGNLSKALDLVREQA